MNLDELREALLKIPDDSAINKARRRAIIALIIQAEKGERHE